jgi:hypothetical protein
MRNVPDRNRGLDGGDLIGVGVVAFVVVVVAAAAVDEMAVWYEHDVTGELSEQGRGFDGRRTRSEQGSQRRRRHRRRRRCCCCCNIDMRHAAIQDKKVHTGR